MTHKFEPRWTGSHSRFTRPREVTINWTPVVIAVVVCVLVFTALWLGGW